MLSGMLFQARKVLRVATSVVGKLQRETFHASADHGPPRVIEVALATQFYQGPSSNRISSSNMIEEDEKVYRNVHYKSDTNYTIGAASALLTPIGVWPLQRGDSLLDNIKNLVHATVVFVLICFFVIPQVIYTFFNCENLTRYMKVIASQVFSVLAIIKFWTMVINRKKIRHCLTQIEVQYRDVECEEDRVVMTNSAKFGRFFMTLYLGFSYGGGVPYHALLPFMSERIVQPDNTTRTDLPYQSNYVFFSPHVSPVYEILVVCQVLTSGMILTLNCGTYSLIASITMHSCCLFEVVSRKLDTFMENDEDELDGRLNGIIRHHLKAIEFAERIEEAISTVCFTEMVGCTLILCFIEFGIILDLEELNLVQMLIFLTLMLSIFINVFILSYVGDRLRQESERVGKSTYFTQWYNLPDHLIKNMRMIILRGNRPSCFTAARLFTLSLQAFCDVCKTSAAYLNFLRAVMG